MIADKIIQPPNLYQQRLQQEKPENRVVLAKSDTKSKSQRTERHQPAMWRMLMPIRTASPIDGQNETWQSNELGALM